MTHDNGDNMGARQVAGWVGLAVLLVVAASWAFTGNALALYQVFAPRTEAVRRQTFEQSRAFNQGMVQELENMQFQYERADSASRAALASIIRHRASGYNLNDPALPQSLRTFINSLKESK